MIAMDRVKSLASQQGVSDNFEFLKIFASPFSPLHILGKLMSINRSIHQIPSFLNMSAKLQMCYDTVKSIDLKYFKWNFPTESNVVPDDKHSLGFIAQEVKTVFPNAVSESNSYGYSDFLSLNTDQILKAMYGALKQTMADKEALEQSLETATAQLQTIEQRLAALESKLSA